MKKVFALLLCLAMVVTVFAGCQNNDDEDKGATIPMYLSSEIYSFDPAVAYTDEAAVKVLGLVYEGLFRVNSSGKVEKAICKSYKITEDPENDIHRIEFKLKNTAWSDGRLVQAQDFVYAIKRVMEPEFHGEAASMLFDIKNARAVKAGDMSIDDLGVVDSDKTVLQIDFETTIDYDQFIEYLASPLLVPIREDAVGKATDWASNTSILVCNGPFVVRSFSPGEKLVLERNIYYYRNVEEDRLKKYVVPYRLSISFKDDSSEQLVKFENGEIVYDAYLPLAKRAEYADKVTTSDMMTSLSYVFNTTKAPFDKADVRNALSLALDRQAIADIVVYAKAATGLITDGVRDAGSKKMFRENGGDLISASADLQKAKDLLNKAGVKGGSFAITIRNNEVDRAVAEYAQGVWKTLGFNVTIVEKSFSKYSNNDYDLVSNEFYKAYEGKDFDVISIDYQMMSTDAFPNLAQFATEFSGGKIDLASGNYEFTPHVSGYSNEEYDTLIESAFAEKDRTKRAEILHQAEEKLLADAPIIPLVTYQHAYIASSDLSKFTTAYYGFNNFAKAKLKDYEQYAEETTLLIPAQ